MFFYFNAIEMLAYLFYPKRVAHSNYGICQLFRQKIKMINGATGIKYQFGFGYSLHEK
jgi:hypothetical protein